MGIGEMVTGGENKRDRGPDSMQFNLVNAHCTGIVNNPFKLFLINTLQEETTIDLLDNKVNKAN